MKRDEFARSLTAGMIGLLVLDVLRDGPSYGYGIRLRLCEQSNHVLKWPEGSLYRVLRQLEQQGLVASAWQGPKGCRRRRYYHLTSRGQQAWAEHRRCWLTFSSAVNAVLALRA